MPDQDNDSRIVINNNVTADLKPVTDAVASLSAIVLNLATKMNALSNKTDQLIMLVQALGTVVTNPADVAAVAALAETLKHSEQQLKAIVDSLHP